MLHVLLGTDTTKALTALNAVISKLKLPAVRLSDASSADDVGAALQGGGMFGGKRTVVLDRLSDNEELWQLVVEHLENLQQQQDYYFLYEEKVDAGTKKLLTKYAEKMETFDSPKSAKPRPTVFALVNYLQAGDRKKLWVGYQQELAAGNAPEAIHGTLFWGAKQAVLSARSAEETQRAKKILVQLTELPHEARRRGEELEYALERFILSKVK
jgi:hypothetical protein